MSGGDKPDPRFREASCQQQRAPEFIGMVLTNSVEIPGRLRFLSEVHDVWSHILHPEGKLTVP